MQYRLMITNNRTMKVSFGNRREAKMARVVLYLSISFFACCLSQLFLLPSAVAQIPFSAQPEKSATRAGNAQYQQQNFAEAEVNYKKALEIKNNMPEASFNLGDAVYQQKRFEEAQRQFQLSAKTSADQMVQAKAFHNLGNSLLEQKKYEEAVSAYKNALKINPADMDTKYNLAFANAMLQKNQGGGGDKNQDQKKQDNKDQQDKDNKDQQEKQQKESQNQQSDKQGQQQSQQQAQQPRLSKEEADQLMAALENEEQKVNQKMQKKQMKGVRVRIKKDW
ncbi:MAG: tetratricopeptide repeat protein [Chitinophagales bacterium]|nr:tetratricopeptide repeat protein [Chitinophagales bacterium]